MSPSLDALTSPLPAWSPRNLRYAAARALLGTVGRLSEGIRIGHRHGFDSGVMLDHVYANEARGHTPLGRLIDRVFLDAPGWVGIRNRGDLLERVIAGEVRRIASERGEATVADLACGGGRYILAALEHAGKGATVRATLRDYQTANVDKAAANARRLGLAVTVERGDAFSDRDLSALPQPDMVVVSGLHEIVADDETVRGHFGQIARVLAPGGRLVLTVQPDHPQVEFIARVLTSHTGRPWAMRLRSVDLTRAWAEAAGFVVEPVEMEAMGIFGVLVARKA